MLDLSCFKSDPMHDLEIVKYNNDFAAMRDAMSRYYLIIPLKKGFSSVSSSKTNASQCWKRSTSS